MKTIMLFLASSIVLAVLWIGLAPAKAHAQFTPCVWPNRCVSVN